MSVLFNFLCIPRVNLQYNNKAPLPSLLLLDLIQYRIYVMVRSLNNNAFALYFDGVMFDPISLLPKYYYRCNNITGLEIVGHCNIMDVGFS